MFEIIEECPTELLNERERFWQDFYDVTSNRGMNCRLTKSKDRSGKTSLETRKNISLSVSGENHPAFGKRGSLCPNYGKKHSEETKDKIRKSKLTKNPMLGRTNEKSHLSKVILDTQTGVFYNSAKEASYLLNMNYSTLKAYLQDRLPNKTTLIYC